MYHNLNHVQNVVKQVKEIGKESGISKKELEDLVIAAWFHDLGYLEVSARDSDVYGVGVIARGRIALVNAGN